MSTITAILEPDADGTLHLPLPEQLHHGKVKVEAKLEAAEPRAAPCPITPALMNPRVEGSNMAFDIRANAGSTVNLSSSTDLKTWIPLASPVVTKGVNKFTVPRSGPKRYYRAK